MKNSHLMCHWWFIIKKVELDSIRKERNHLKKIVEDMDCAGILDRKDMTATNESLDLEKEEKLSNLDSKDGNRSANFKKADHLNEKVLKLSWKCINWQASL